MFNDKYGLTEAVLTRYKTITRRNKDNYKVGEIIAIAQNYKDVIEEWQKGYGNGFSFGLDDRSGFKNKMFVKAAYMPHHIKIKSKRLEHLQSISNSDCLKEGIMPYYGPNGDDGLHLIVGYTFVGGHIYDTPKEAFKALIGKLNGQYFWYTNPKVWVYEFELVD